MNEDNVAAQAWRQFRHHRAYIVGINAYAHGIPPLQTAARDAERLAELLQNSHHFQVDALLTDAQASRAGLLKLLHEQMPAQVGPRDRVLVYFAGHGIALDGEAGENGEVGPEGYLVPADASADPASLIRMREMAEALAVLPCRHLLVILDCCFSGAFRWSSRSRDLVVPPKRMFEDRFARFLQDRACQVITSAAHDQKALDVLQSKALGARGGAPGQHSPFAQALFDGLSGAADSCRPGEPQGDGVITATELYLYLRDVVEPATRAANEQLRQTPSFFPLPAHDKGEFLFLIPGRSLRLPALKPEDSPYKGLASFSRDDAHLFYGRERVIERLVAHTRDPSRPLLVVTGASGTGKSSVVRAGLLPQLKADGLPIVEMRPGAQPQAALDAALAELAQQRAASGRAGVLLVDQLEELVTRRHATGAPAAEAIAAFDTRLAALLADGRELVRIVLTVRADFEPQFSDGLGLGPLWTHARFTVPPFTSAELREVVLMPALQANLQFDDPKLVNDIVEEVVQSPGPLPLLSYAMSELFRSYLARRTGDRLLRRADYEALGGVTGAMTKKADTLYRQGLSPEEQPLLRRAMLRMVSLEGAEPAGKRVAVDELLVTEAETGLIAHVVDKLVDARLVVRLREAGHDLIEPAHDALVRAWKQLTLWIDATGRDTLMLAAKLGDAARAERDAPVRAGLLWDANPNLAAVEAQLRSGSPLFNLLEQRFIHRSVALKKRRWRIGAAVVVSTVLVLAAIAWVAWRERGAALQAAREAEARSLASSAELALADAPDRALLLALASRERQPLPLADSVIARAHATAPYLLALQPPPAPASAQADEAALLAVSDRSFVSVELASHGEALLTQQLQRSPTLWDTRTGQARPLKPLPGEPPLGADTLASFSPDGLSFVSFGGDGKLRLWDVASGHQRLALQGSAGPLSDASVSPDGHLVMATEGPVLRFWDAQTGQPQGELQLGYQRLLGQWLPKGQGLLVRSDAGGCAQVLPSGVKPYPFNPGAGTPTLPICQPSPDGSHVLVGQLGAEVLSVPLDGGRPKPMPQLPPGAMGTATAGAVEIAVGGQAMARIELQQGPTSLMGVVSLLTTSQSRPIRLPAEVDASTQVTVLRFSPDGQRLVIGREDGALHWHDARSGAALALWPGHRGRVTDLQFSPDGQRLVSASSDGSVIVWSVQGQRLRTLRGAEGSVVRAFFSLDGQRIISVDQLGPVRVWDATETPERRTMLQAGTSAERKRQALSLDGRWLAVSEGAKLRLFSVPPAAESGTPEAAPRHASQARIGAIEHLVFSRDGRWLASNDDRGQIELWDVARGRSVALLQGPPYSQGGFSPDGAWLLARGTSELHRWPLSDQGVGPSPASTVALPPPGTRGAGFTPDGQALVLAPPEGRPMQWPIDQAWMLPRSTAVLSADRRRLLGHGGAQSQVFTRGDQTQGLSLGFGDPLLGPDGNLVVLYDSNSGRLRFIDAASGVERRAVQLEVNGAQMRFSPDGQFLLVASEWKRLRVFQVATGTLLREVSAEPGNGLSLTEFLPDNRTLLVLQDNHVLRLLPCPECVSLPEMLRRASARVGRSLTSDERLAAGLRP